MLLHQRTAIARRRSNSAILAMVTVTCALSASVGCRRSAQEIVVFHAASLTRVLDDLASSHHHEHPEVRIRLEPSGSQVAARKVSEQGLTADLVVVADAKVIQRVLLPSHASFDLVFATNGIVLAHKDHSAHTAEISPANWPEILRRPNVRLGRADPDTAPIGYHTILVWQLAERSGTYGESARNLSDELLSRCAKQHVVHDETELLGQLESKAIDYAFLYRSTAEDHHLKITTLPTEQDLSRPELAAQYAVARVEVRMKQGEGKTMVQGSPITYGLTIPNNATHRTEATGFIGFLLSNRGRKILEQRGFRPMIPARCEPCDGLSPELGGGVVVPY